ncbi:hypothetical protein G9A89_009459 [Geosiphon pyriformis]|nr:hypothetical protein G9A89_009459 [Geosiphon pyriformis]
MLQNDLEKIYTIEPNKKIAQAIFLPLVKIAQLVLIRNREELKITTREINGFKSMNRIDIPINMTEEKIVDKREIISNQYILAIKRKIKDQAQIFEVKTTICESETIELINLYIPAKSSKHVKISIYNTTEDVIEIPKRTTIRYLSIEVEKQPPNTISDFPQLCRYVNITS